jgi:hypothetical protein
LWDVLEVGLWESVSVGAEEALNRYPVAKLNSGFEFPSKSCQSDLEHEPVLQSYTIQGVVLVMDPFADGIEASTLDTSSVLRRPCFSARVLCVEAAESTGYPQRFSEYYVSGSLGQQDHPAKSVLDITTTFDLVFSSDRSSDKFTGKPVSQNNQSVSSGAYHSVFSPIS